MIKFEMTDNQKVLKNELVKYVIDQNKDIIQAILSMNRHQNRYNTKFRQALRNMSAQEKTEVIFEVCLLLNIQESMKLEDTSESRK